MKPVTDLYSSECPVCGGWKRVQFITFHYSVNGEKSLRTKEAKWGELTPPGTDAIDCFCSHCGIKFIYPI